MIIKKPRRTLKYIQHYPKPREVYESIIFGDQWPYKTNVEYYKKRDRALAAITYLLAARISEVLRLETWQITIENNRVVVERIELSKSFKKGKPRNDLFRPEGWLPLLGNRAPLTELVTDYLAVCKTKRLFPFGRIRAWQIITTITKEPCHWLRAFGENYLYDVWDKDILAVSDYIKVDVRTLQKYIRRSYQKYEAQ